jgi:hypothetical protein
VLPCRLESAANNEVFVHENQSPEKVPAQPLASTVDAEIAFLADTPRRPVFHDYPSPDDFLPLEQHLVTITALHGKQRTLSLAHHGITTIQDQTIDPQAASSKDRTAYLRQLEEIVRKAVGATRVTALGNGVVRRSERAPRHRADGTTVLGRFAHSDFTRSAAGSSLWVEQMLSSQGADQHSSSRFAIYNVWQSLTEPPQDTPLAFCDPATVAPGDFAGCDQVLENPEQGTIRYELNILRYRPAQHWFYFPDLRRDELLIFTGYDSDSAQPQGIAHAAFTDPSCPAEAPARESFDERLIAFFD